MFHKGFCCIPLIILASACGGGASSGAEGISPSNASSSSSSPSAQSPATEETDDVILQWQRPERRENGDYLEADEIGGYELRYKKLTSDEYSYLVLEDGWRESYEFQQELVGAYEFQIAAFDTNGLYSEFVDLQAY